MATIARSRSVVARTVSGNSPQILYLKEGTPTWTGQYLGGNGGLGKSSTGFFMAGAALYLNSTQGLDVMRRLSATGADAAAVRVVGIAAEPGIGTTTNEVAIYAANLDNIFIGNVGSVTSVATATISRIKIGEVAGASVNSSRFFPNTTSGAASSFVRILNKYEGDSFGDTYGRCYFQFLGSRSLWF